MNFLTKLVEWFVRIDFPQNQLKTWGVNVVFFLIIGFAILFHPFQGYFILSKSSGPDPRGDTSRNSNIVDPIHG